MPDLRPTTTIYLQFDAWSDADGTKHDKGYYPIQLDATAGFVLLPGAGVGTLTFKGKTYDVPIADPAATVAPASDVQADLVAALALPIATVTPDTFIASLTSSNAGLIDLQPGHYVGTYDFTVQKSE